MEWLRILAPRKIYYLLLHELDWVTKKFVADLVVFKPFNFRACFTYGFLLFVPGKFAMALLCPADLTQTAAIDIAVA